MFINDTDDIGEWKQSSRSMSTVLGTNVRGDVKGRNRHRNSLSEEVRWYSGTVVQWYSGTVVQWYSGTVVQWYSGTVVQWYSGTVVQW